MKVGILGGGQLARMLALSAIPLGFEVVCYEKEANTCASIVTEIIEGDYFNADSIKAFAKQVDVVSFETENLPLSLAQEVEKYCKVFPCVESLKVCQDRLLEKSFCQQLGIPTTQYQAVQSLSELQETLKSFPLPAILKTRFSGYDGKGQFVINQASEAQQAWNTLKDDRLILEAFFPFEEEVSLIAVRDQFDSIAYYPLTHNLHRQGILRVSKAPYDNEHLQQQAQVYAKAMLHAFNYVGVLAIEFFVKDNKLCVNEMAPRVHNSGHWTIEGAVTSQFENHIRAVTGNHLGATDPIGYSAMFNSIGQEPKLADVLNILGAHYHTYGKQPRPGRKLGHVTLNTMDKKNFDRGFDACKKLFDENEGKI